METEPNPLVIVQDELEVFLENTAQNILEEYDALFKKPAAEEKPYEFKYEGRDKLEILLKNPLFTESSFKENKDLKALQGQQQQTKIIQLAIVTFLLGHNFLETEQSKESEKYFIWTLELFSNFEEKDLEKYYCYIIESKNSLGFIHLNFEEEVQNNKGIDELVSAKELYTKLKEIGLLNKTEIFENIKENKSESSIFQPFYKGKFSNKHLETLHTLTLFYLAQGYTKLGKKDIGATYCGQTMQRQLAFNDFQVKDWCLNCVSLSEFYFEEKNFSQAQYLVNCAAEILAKEEKKHKLKAIVASATGRVYQEFLNFSTVIVQNHIFKQVLLTNYDKEELIKSKEKLEKDLNLQLVIFPQISVKFSKYEILKDNEQVKLWFRFANTQYKKALTFFVLDGYVTEHVNILFEQSALYKQLQLLEENQNRKFQLLERRRELLEPVLKQINPQAFIQLNQKLLVQLAEICIAMFDNRFDELIIKATKITKKAKIEEMNQYGQQGIKYYEQIEEILHKQKQDIQADQLQDYYQSIINARFNMAKAYSKIYSDEKLQKVQTLKKSLENYKWMVEFITKIQQEGVPFQPFAEQFKICKEMIDLLPNKIDKIAFSS